MECAAEQIRDRIGAGSGPVVGGGAPAARGPGGGRRFHFRFVLAGLCSPGDCLELADGASRR